MSDSKSAQQGQAACPCWATCLPHLGKRRAQIELILYVITHPSFQTEESARSTPFLAVSVLRFLSYIYICSRILSLSVVVVSRAFGRDTNPLISKPSRQLADSWMIVNYLFVRILRRKTRWSDSFSAILAFTENQVIFTTFTHIYQHRLISPTGYIWLMIFGFHYGLIRASAGALPFWCMIGYTR